MHPVIASTIAPVRLVHMHPSLDSNGCTSRRLSMSYLDRAGHDVKRLFAMSEFDDRDRTACYDAFQLVRRRPMDVTRRIEFFTHGLATHRPEVRQRGEHAMRQDVLARRYNLTERQVMAVGVVLDQGGLTIADVQRPCPGTPRRTLQRDFRGLVEKGVLERRGQTNRVDFQLARVAG